METREFPIAVIASLTTGRLLCDFTDLHEAAEYLMGHPIWSHEFGDKKLCEEIKNRVLDQYPKMPTIAEGVNKENYKEFVAKLENEISSTIKIRKIKHEQDEFIFHTLCRSPQ